MNALRRFHAAPSRVGVSQRSTSPIFANGSSRSSHERFLPSTPSVSRCSGIESFDVNCRSGSVNQRVSSQPCLPKWM